MRAEFKWLHDFFSFRLSMNQKWMVWGSTAQYHTVTHERQLCILSYSHSYMFVVLSSRDYTQYRDFTSSNGLIDQ